MHPRPQPILHAHRGAPTPNLPLPSKHKIRDQAPPARVSSQRASPRHRHRHHRRRRRGCGSRHSPHHAPASGGGTTPTTNRTRPGCSTARPARALSGRGGLGPRRPSAGARATACDNGSRQARGRGRVWRGRPDAQVDHERYMGRCALTASRPWSQVRSIAPGTAASLLVA